MNEMMPEVGEFATTGTLNEDFLRRHIRYMGIWRNAMILLGAYLVLAVLSLALYLLAGQMSSLLLMLACLVLAFWRPYRYYHRWLKLSMARMKETSPEGEEVITVSCTEQGVRIENQTSGGAATIAYANIARAVETEDTLLIQTRAKQMTAFFKSSLTEQECTDLKVFLLNKGVKVKSL